MVTIDPDNLHNLVQQTVFEDPSGGMINGRIISQFTQFLSVSDLTEEERQQILELLIVIGMKFVAVWTHDGRYGKREAELMALATGKPVDRRKNEPMRLMTAQDLYLEFDGFLVQTKSTLDHMINVLHYTHGLSFSGLTTFAGKGKTIINQLKGVTKKNQMRRKSAEYLIQHIEDNQEWLGTMIDIRDRMNHFLHGGIPPRHFAVAFIIEADGTENLHRPLLAPDTPVKTIMSNLLRSLLDFVEHFIGVAMAARMPGYAIKWTDHADPKLPRWSVLHELMLQAMIASGHIKPA
jgi:hypothetical protein